MRPAAVSRDNDIVTVKSAAGEIKVPVEVTDAIKPGVVSMPHGWGHGKPGTRMSVANSYAGRQHQRPVPADVPRRAVGQRRAQRHPGDRHHGRGPLAVARLDPQHHRRMWGKHRSGKGTRTGTGAVFPQVADSIALGRPTAPAVIPTDTGCESGFVITTATTPAASGLTMMRLSAARGGPARRADPGRPR